MNCLRSGYSSVAVALCCVALAWLPSTAVADRSVAVGPSFDHLVLAVPRLEAGAELVAEVLGVPLSPGGEHPGLGSANYLLSFGGRRYLEVIGPQPGPGAMPPFARRLSAVSVPDLRTFAVAAGDLERIEAAAQTAGITTTGIAQGSRRTRDGRLLRWRRLYTYSDEFEGLVPFFIDWLDTPHPAASVTGDVQLARFYVTHPNAAALRRVYAALGVAVPVEASNRPGIVVELQTPSGEVVLLGSGEGLQWEE